MADLNFWRSKRVLITGIDGFIGWNLAHTLNRLGAVVFGVRRTNNVRNFDPFRSVSVDIRDYSSLCQVLSSSEAEFVFHLAACSIVRNSARDPLTTYGVNVLGTATLLEAARNVGKAKSIIVASSDKAFGEHEVLPYTESHPLQPKNTYDTSKACADMIARSYAHNYDMPVSVSRCSNVYGPGDLNLSRIIPNTIMRLLRGQHPMLYSDVAEMEREFIYVSDVVDAYLAAAINLYSGGGLCGSAFNVGGQGPRNIKSVVELVCDQMMMPPEVEIVQREPTFKEIKRQYLDASLLTLLTGWSPKVQMEDGIGDAVTWYENEFEQGRVR